MFKKLLILFIISYSFISPKSLNQSPITRSNKFYFIKNEGQWPIKVKYLAKIGGMDAWITNSGVIYDFNKVNIDTGKALGYGANKIGEKKLFKEGNIVSVELISSNVNASSFEFDKCNGYYNYFIGNDTNKWITNIPLYQNVELVDIYIGINVKYYFENGTLRYDFIAKPQADISQIKFRYCGQENLHINSDGELVVKTQLGDINHGKILVYQNVNDNQIIVEGKFEQENDGIIGLKINQYDKRKTLIIDPLVYSTFIGGNDKDYGNSITVDKSGNAYITGFAFSSTFPSTTGAYNTTSGGVFVTKLNSSGTDFVYSTFIGTGGKFGDEGNSIAVDDKNNAYITGFAGSKFPTTSGAYKTVSQGSYSAAFVTKLDSSGSKLIYSTYIGNNDGNQGNSIAVDIDGDAYITGSATSNYPTTSGAYQTSANGSLNTFITKLNSTGSNLIYSTFLGNNDNGNSLVIDSKGYVYLTGQTGSTNFPTTAGAFQNTGTGVYVTKLNQDGSGLIYSTLIGKGGSGKSIAIDNAGNAYLTGWCGSDFPTTQGVYKTTYDSGPFVVKLNPTGSNLVYSTFIGTANVESIAVDAGGNAFLTGGTNNSNFPVTPDAFQTIYGSTGANNVFLSVLNPGATNLLYSTYIGGADGCYANSITVDDSENVFITGLTMDFKYPSTPGVIQPNLGGNYVANAFITKMNLNIKQDSTVYLIPIPIPIPDNYSLSQNFPNPFNPSTVINYSIPTKDWVTIKLYNILGKEIAVLVNEEKDAGYYSFQFSNKEKLSSGIYLYTMRAGNFATTKKMLLIK